MTDDLQKLAYAVAGGISGIIARGFIANKLSKDEKDNLVSETAERVIEMKNEQIAMLHCKINKMEEEAEYCKQLKRDFDELRARVSTIEINGQNTT